MRLEKDYKTFRRAVLKRDGYKCQMPNCSARKRLVVHHILPYSRYKSLRTDSSNGISLCRKCHKTVNGKEMIYANLFLTIVGQNENKKTRNKRGV